MELPLGPLQLFQKHINGAHDHSAGSTTLPGAQAAVVHLCRHYVVHSCCGPLWASLAPHDLYVSPQPGLKIVFCAPPFHLHEMHTKTVPEEYQSSFFHAWFGLFSRILFMSFPCSVPPMSISCALRRFRTRSALPDAEQRQAMATQTRRWNLELSQREATVTMQWTCYDNDNYDMYVPAHNSCKLPRCRHL